MSATDDTRPNGNIFHLIWEELQQLRSEMKDVREEIRQLRNEQITNTKKIKDDIDNRFNAFDIAMDLLQQQYQSTGEEIGQIRKNCVNRGVAISKLAKSIGTPIPIDVVKGL